MRLEWTEETLCRAARQMTQGLAAALPELFDRPAAGAFLVFLLLYPPCVSALAVMRRELSDRRLLWFGIAWQCVVAYLCALAARLLLSVGT